MNIKLPWNNKISILKIGQQFLTITVYRLHLALKHHLKLLYNFRFI